MAAWLNDLRTWLNDWGGHVGTGFAILISSIALYRGERRARREEARETKAAELNLFIFEEERGSIRALDTGWAGLAQVLVVHNVGRGDATDVEISAEFIDPRHRNTVTHLVLEPAHFSGIVPAGRRRTFDCFAVTRINGDWDPHEILFPIQFTITWRDGAHSQPRSQDFVLIQPSSPDGSELPPTAAGDPP